MSPPSREPGSKASAAADLADREDPYHVAQASRIYLLPNLMTAANLACGFMAVICCIRANYWMRVAGIVEPSDLSNAVLVLTPAAVEQFKWAVWLIFAAAAFDSLDGRLARMGGRESLFGAEFDSLADVVSFGFAPALLAFFLILSPVQGYPVFRQIGGFLSFIYLLCAAIRLARFNVITNPLLHRGAKDSDRDFVGLPVPAAAGTVAALVLALLDLGEKNMSLHRWALGLPPLLALIAVMMITTVRYPSGKQLDLQTRLRVPTFLALVATGGIVWLFKEYGILACSLAYIFFGLIRHFRRKSRLHRHRNPL